MSLVSLNGYTDHKFLVYKISLLRLFALLERESSLLSSLKQ